MTRIRSKLLEFPEHCEGGHQNGEERIEIKLPIWVAVQRKTFYVVGTLVGKLCFK